MDREKIALNVPMLTPFAGLVTGILLCGLGAGVIEGMACIVAGIVLYELLIRLNVNPLKAYKIRHWHYLWVGLVFTGTGMVSASFAKPINLPDNFLDKEVVAIGRIHDYETRTDGDHALVHLEAVADSTGKTFSVPGIPLMLKEPLIAADLDDRIIFPCRITRIKDSPYSFSQGYALRMERKGILYTARTDGEEAIKPAAGDSYRSIHGTCGKIRADIEQLIEQTPLGKPTQRFLITVLLGDRTYLTEDTRQLFADAGLSHMLALSGMHVSIITGILLWILFPFNLIGLYRWRYLLAVPALWGYAMITGLNPSTVRAALMATILITALLMERRNSPWNALLLATFIILLFNPASLYDIGLQLSFICVAALIFFVRPLNPVSQRKRPYLYKFASALLVTLTATAASWAMVAYYFGIFPLSFIISNLIALPLLPAYMVAAILYMALWTSGYGSGFLQWLLDSGYSGLTGFLGNIGGGEQTVMHLSVSGITVALWLVAIALLVLWMHQKRSVPRIILALTAFVGALVSIPVYASVSSRDEAIVTNEYQRPSIALKQNSEQRRIDFPVASVSERMILGSRVVVADCGSDGVRIKPGCDLLIITRSCKNSISELTEIFRPKKIIIHNSVRRDREKSLIHEADSLGIPVHSIRLNEPLHIFPRSCFD